MSRAPNLVVRRLPRDLAVALTGFGWVGLGLLLDHDATIGRRVRCTDD